MDDSSRISAALIRRLPRYYRYLSDLTRQGIRRISSQELGERMGLTASQIRQDINCFGGIGQQGYGYVVEALRARIGQLLGAGSTYEMIVVGAGNIGQAIANYDDFFEMGFQIHAMFDVNAGKMGKGKIPVFHMDTLEAYLQEHHVDIAVIAAPAANAQQIYSTLVEGGVRAIWNFAPVDLAPREDVAVENVHLSDGLMVLAYRMESQKG